MSFMEDKKCFSQALHLHIFNPYKMESHMQSRQRATGHTLHLQSSLTSPYPILKKKATLADCIFSQSACYQRGAAQLFIEYS